ncbi:MAG: hypothetical protein J6S84_03930 [Bacteroidales bacterium]|nr:hypothetical protein [Bacteroidales bacterium]
MKKILTILVLLAAFTGVYAQQQGSVVPDNRLYSKFQSDDINNMVNLLPQEITYWNWFADNGFVVKNTSQEVAHKYPALKFYDKDTKLAAEEEIAYDEATFNIMAYDFEILPDKTNIYRIGDTGYIVNIYSSRKLVEKYNKFMRNE